ncbi:MAG: alpha-amylase family glycosyl hydrolase [Deinococcota bacterium]
MTQYHHPTVFTYPDLPKLPDALVKEIHVSKDARARYSFDDDLFSFHGNAIIADFVTAQDVATTMNDVRQVAQFPELTVHAGDLYSMGLLDEIFHLVIAIYRQDNPDFDSRAAAFLREKLGEDAFETTLQRFAETFPPVRVYKGEELLETYLAATTDGTPHKHVVLEELLLLYINNENPALERFLDLFDDTHLETTTAYREVIGGLSTFFDDEPTFGPSGTSLFDLLQMPARLSPTSLEGQLDILRNQWGSFLGERFEQLMARILRAVDVLKEERKGRGSLPGGFVPGPAPVLSKENLRGAWMERGFEPVEYERYSVDSSWMPNVVMLAKSTYVWLDQLSKRFQQDINQLDQIPDEVLDELAERGFTALWLIGLWERSEASKTIKNMMGNPDAVASAYSLYDYAIAHDLGGEAAYENLRDRAWQRGIRLASDMVPNHMAIDSRWVAEHPDWFLALPDPPYPSYSFTSPNLSQDDRMTVQLEDHYFDKSDAAVVFCRIDNQTGERRYIYHGNDGTSMPWNDTAQLNYLDPKVREGVIQTILHVARKFPVIRFDAAMTLAKQHIQRLWFPQPGAGGAIPSRAQRGMTTEEFDAHIPEEFWREVVNRVAEEVPDTLLLAEAFWMMEGYFVRTLGMHRVYNSAFMNMLKREANADYRLTIRNVLEFDPQILKRFVNFMNNPDEETALFQFGKDDKYFGVCTLMVTMPGLPMFGHGQLEGFSEKYGMEYRRARYDEQPDEWLMARHAREIFPLMHRRWQFSEVDNFLLYDFVQDGQVNENVFAYSNVVNDKASLVLYHNSFATARGWIKTSVAFAVKDGDDSTLMQRDLASGLALNAGDANFTILHDHMSGLDYLQRSSDLAERGMYVELDAFKYHVFADIEEVYDSDGLYQQLYDELGGQPVQDAKASAQDIHYRPLHTALYPLLSAQMVAYAYPLGQDHRLEDVSAASSINADASTEDGDVEPSQPQTSTDSQQAHQQTTASESAEDASVTDTNVADTDAASDTPASDTSKPDDYEDDAQSEYIAAHYTAFLQAAQAYGAKFNRTKLLQDFDIQKRALARLAAISDIVRDASTALARDLERRLSLSTEDASVIVAWLFVRQLGALRQMDADASTHLEAYQDWRIERALVRGFAQQHTGQFSDASGYLASLVTLLVRYQDWASGQPPSLDVLREQLAEDRHWQDLIGVHDHDSVRWFNGDAFERVSNLLLVVAVLQASLEPEERADAMIVQAYQVMLELDAAKQASSYRFHELVDGVTSQQAQAPTSPTEQPNGTPTTVADALSTTPKPEINDAQADPNHVDADSVDADSVDANSADRQDDIEPSLNA